MSDTPITDANEFDWTDVCRGEAPAQPARVVDADIVRGLERKIASLRKDAERYQFLRDGEYPEDLLQLLIKAGIHKNKVDAAIDAAIG